MAVEAFEIVWTINVSRGQFKTLYDKNTKKEGHVYVAFCMRFCYETNRSLF